MGNINNGDQLPNKIEDLKFVKSTNQKYLRKKTKGEFNHQFKFRWSVHSRPEYVYVIHYAASVGSAEGLRHIITIGADVNQKTDSGLTPLHFAILFRNVDALEVLVDLGADTDEKEYGLGFTPLHYACENKDYVGAKKLLQLTADPHISDKNNDTPLDMVKRLNHRPLVKLISSYYKRSANSQHLNTFRKQVNMSLSQLSHRLSELNESLHIPTGSFYGYNQIEASSRQQSHMGPRSGSYASLTSVDTLHSLHESGIGTVDGEITNQLSRRASQFKYPDAEKIQENFEVLNFNLSHTTDIINKMFTKKQLNFRLKEKLKQLYGSEKNEELLDYVIKTNVETYQAFVTALQETGQTKLANLLLPSIISETKALFKVDNILNDTRGSDHDNALVHSRRPLYYSDNSKVTNSNVIEPQVESVEEETVLHSVYV